MWLLLEIIKYLYLLVAPHNFAISNYKSNQILKYYEQIII